MLTQRVNIDVLSVAKISIDMKKQAQGKTLDYMKCKYNVVVYVASES